MRFTDSVNNENFMHTFTIFLKLILTFKYTNMVINLTTTIHIASKVSEVSAIRNRHTCKKIFLLALVCSIAPIDIAFDVFSTILVMVPVDAGFLGGYKPIYSIWSTLALHLTFRFRLS